LTTTFLLHPIVNCDMTSLKYVKKVQLWYFGLKCSWK